MSAQQAYITGFVKRANEYGLTNNQAIELLKMAEPQSPNARLAIALNDAKANVPLQTLFGGGLPGIGYNMIKDHGNKHLRDEDDDSLTWSIVKNQLGGAGLGALGGLGIAGIGNMLAGDGFLDRAHSLPGAQIGAMLGGIAGNYRGASKYNEAIDKKLSQL